MDVTIPGEQYDITATYTLPAGEGPFPLVVMSHGFLAERNQRGGFTALAVALAERGIASLRMDFAGCGDSPADFQYNNLTGMASDVITCCEWALNNLPVDANAVGLLGYSLGTLVTLRATLAQPDICHAMVLIAPAGMVNMRDIYMGEYQQAQQDGYFTTTSNGREYRISTSWYEDLFSLELLFQTYAERENSLIIYGTQDAMIPVETALACAEQIGAQTLEVAGGYHSMGLSGTLPAVFEKVRAGVVDFFVETLESNPASASAGASTEQGGMQSGQGSGSITFN